MEKYLYDDLNLVEQTHWWHLAKRRIISLLIKVYLPNRKLKIIDVGCGTGANIQAFSQFGQVWGIDKSKQAIKFCQKKGLKNVKLASSDQIPFSARSFDLVLMLDVLEHVDEDPSLKEVWRILKPNQYLIITVPAFSWLWSKWDEVLHHKRRYTTKLLAKTLEKNNFKVEKISYMYSFIVIPILLIRTIKSLKSKQSYSSDFKLSFNVINQILLAISFIEMKIILLLGVPFGTSIICVAKKHEK